MKPHAVVTPSGSGKERRRAYQIFIHVPLLLGLGGHELPGTHKEGPQGPQSEQDR